MSEREQDEPDTPEVSGNALRPLEARSLSIVAVVGMVLGWLTHPVGDAVMGAVPEISWMQVAVLAVAALALSGVAGMTWRQLRVQRQRIRPELAVNRLVLGRACALVGAFVSAGYVGHAVGWLGHGSEVAGQRLLVALLAALAALVLTGAGLVLERACRNPAPPAPPVS